MVEEISRIVENLLEDLVVSVQNKGLTSFYPRFFVEKIAKNKLFL
jgi:hypothetical protein